MNLTRLITAIAFALWASWAAADASGPRSSPCPEGLPAGSQCHTGQDEAGAFYWIALPPNWRAEQGVLMMHAHGGPELGVPRSERSRDDLKRWAVMVRAGYAWAGSTYRRGGYGVRMAGEDTERLRQLFVQTFGQPRRTVLHGQSYGGGVASKAAETYGPVSGARAAYDGVLLTNGVLSGGGSAYEFRLDLRVIYQYLCRNHPLPEEEQYPLWMGLPAGAPLTRAELAARVQTCTGLGLPAAKRSEQQAARLKTLLSVVRVPESSLQGHLNWATWLFQDLVQQRLEGRNPFGNAEVVYHGSDDDTALNAGVLRYRADPQAVAALAADSRPTGRLNLPVLTLHAIEDPTAFVELESAYRDIVQSAGASQWLVQTFSDESQHSYVGDAHYPALMKALLQWIDQGERPTPATVAQLCTSFEPEFGRNCRFRSNYSSAALNARVPQAGR